MRASQLLVEFYDVKDDELDVQKLEDTRRPRLTLMHLSRLRKARDLERVERAHHLNELPDMYGPQDDASAGGGGPFG